MFLVAGANVDKCKAILSTFSELPIGPFIWPALRSNEPKQFWTTFECHIEILLQMMNIDTYFEFAHLSATEIINYVLNNSFLNILEWNEICHLLVFLLTNPPEYFIYYLVLMLDHIKKDISNLCVSFEFNVFEKVSLDH